MKKLVGLLISFTIGVLTLPSYATEFCNFPYYEPVEGEVAVVGQAVDSDRERFKVLNAFKGRVVEVGGSSATLVSTVVSGNDSIYSKLIEKKSGSFGLGSSVGSFSLSKSKEFMRTVNAKNYAMTFMVKFDMKLPNEKFEVDTSNGTPLTSYAQSLLNDSCKFKQIFGDSFIFQTQRGASVYVAISVSFSSFDAFSDYKKNMSVGVEANFKGFEGTICTACGETPISIPEINLKASFDKSRQNTNQVTINNGRVDVIAMQEGGDATRLGQIFGTGRDISIASCSLSNLDSCSQAFSNVLAYLAQEEFASGVKNYPTVLNYISRPYWEIDPSIQLVKEVTPAVEAARKNLAQELLNREANVGKVSDVLASSPLLVAPSAEADRQYLMDLKLKLEQDIEKLRAAGFTCFSDLSNCESVSTQVLKNLTVFDNAALQSYLTDGLIAYFPFDLQHQSSQRPVNSRPFAAQLFSYFDFQGNVEVLTEDKPFLTLNDLVYSVRVTPGCTVTLYDLPSYIDNLTVKDDVYYLVESKNNLNYPNFNWIKRASSAKFSCAASPNGSTLDATGKHVGAVYGTELANDRMDNPSSSYQFGGGKSINISSDVISPHMTVGAWIKPSSLKPSTIISRFTHGSGAQYALRLDGAGEIGFHIRRTPSGTCDLMGGWYRVGAGILSEIDKWSFVVGTWDGNVMKIYVNGELKNSRTDVLSGGIDYCVGTAATLVGMGENGIEPFSGNIDDMVFYNRALSQAEITQLHAGKKPSVAQFIATVNNLTVNVDASSSIGNIQSYEWTSSDGQTKSGKTATFAFSKTGTYTITLTTKDDKGVISQAAKTVQIQNSVPSLMVLTVSKQGTGTVSGTGINCGTDCTESLAANTTVTLTATPAASFTFAGWDGCTSNNNVCQLTLNADKSVTAKFTATTPPPVTPPVVLTPECVPFHAIYTSQDRLLNIPFMEIPMVTIIGGVPTNRVESYSAVFRLLNGSEHFQLKDVTAPTLEKTDCLVANYNPETGMLYLPYVDIPIITKIGNKQVETQRAIYEATLHWVPLLGNNIFVIEKVKQLQ